MSTKRIQFTKPELDMLVKMVEAEQSRFNRSASQLSDDILAEGLQNVADKLYAGYNLNEDGEERD